MAPHLRILAGPTSSTEGGSLEDITHLVNTTGSFPIRTDYFEGEIAVNIQGLFNGNESPEKDSRYFEREDRKGVTWSLQVRGRFLQTTSADDILFGNTFDRPLWLPWGSGAVFKFMQYMDPTLEHDLGSQTRPWALSPLISTMPHFEHVRLTLDSELDDREGKRPAESVFPPITSIGDKTDDIHKAIILTSSSDSSGEESDASSIASSRSSGGKSTSSKSSIKSIVKNRMKKQSRGQKAEQLKFADATERRSYFSDKARRESIQFGPEDVISVDFCYGFLEFSPSLALKIPPGLSFDLMKYWDGQPVRFVCCERKKGGSGGDEPWGRIFWTVVIEPRDPAEVNE